MTTTSTIATRYNVTDEQISAAHRIFDCNKHITFYVVESASSDQEYRVYFNYELRHLVCNCKAGQNGTPCWHRRAVQAANEEFKAERQAMETAWMAELQQEIDAEAKHYGAYTVVVDETSSSLDGITYERAPSGKMVPMR